MTTAIVYHPARGPGRRAPQASVHIGQVTAVGKVLDKAAFATLCASDRLRAYLLMVWPAARSGRLLERLCDASARSIATLLRHDLQAGDIQRLSTGWYRATPTTPPAQVRRVLTPAGE
jgi:hypothetical protein